MANVKTRYKNNYINLGQQSFDIVSTSGIHKSDINFLGREFNSLWPVTSNDTFVITNSPLKISSPASTASQMNSLSSVSVSEGKFYHFEYSFVYQTKDVVATDIKQRLLCYDNIISPASFIQIDYYASDSVDEFFRINIDSFYGSYTVDVPLSGSRSYGVRLSYVSVGADTYLYVAVKDDQDIIYASDNGDPFLFGLGVGNTLYFREYFFETSLIESSFLIRPKLFYPFISVPLSTDFFPYPTPEGFNQSKTTYRVTPGQIGTFSGGIYGVGSNFGTVEAYEATVIDSYYTDSTIKLLVSPINNFETDDVDDLTCPELSYEIENRGNLSATNECFCDGSELDGSEMSIHVSKSGRLDNKNGLPEFTINHNDKVYGENFDFNRIHLGSENAISGDSIKFLRMLPLSNGKRFYYGIKTAEPTTFDQTMDVYIKWESDLNNAEDGIPVELERWLEYESYDGQIDYQSFAPGTYVLGTDSHIRYNLPYGRYSFKFNKAMGWLFASMNYEVAVYLGTDDTGEKLVEWPMWRKTEDTYTCELKFEVKENQGELIVGLHDPCAGTFELVETGFTDFNLKTDSLGAFELPSGEVVIVYDFHNGTGLWSSLGNEVFYRKVTLDPSISVSAPGVMTLPKVDKLRDEYIHCFDLYEDDEDNVYLLFSKQLTGYHDSQVSTVELNTWSYPTKNYLNKDINFYYKYEPFVSDQVYILKFNKYDYSWAAGNTINLPISNKSFELDSIKSIVTALTRQPSVVSANDQNLYGNTIGLSFAAAAKIRANFNKDFNCAVICVIDQDLRVGDVFLAYKDNVIEVGYPTVFNQMSKTTIDSPSIKSWSKLESLSADFGNDGFIYGVATSITTDQSLGDIYDTPQCEMFQIDPNYIFLNDMPYLKFIRGESFKNWDNLKLHIAEFNQSPTPLMTRYDGYAENEFQVWNGSTYVTTDFHYRGDRSGLIFAEYRNDKHFGVLTYGGSRVTRPVIYQNSELDVNPFKTFSVMNMIPEVYGNAGQYDISNVTATDDYFILEDNASASRVRDDLQLYFSKFRGHNTKGDVGYKFHARIKTIPNGGPLVDMTVPVTFHAIGKAGTLGNSLLAVPTTFVELEARFTIYGLSVFCEYWDQVFGGWRTLQTITLDEHGIYDYYIIVRNHGLETDGDAIARGDFCFIVKKFEHVFSNDANNDDKFNLFYNALEHKYVITNIGLKTSTTETTRYEVTMPGSSSSEQAYLYELGYSLLVADFGNVELFQTTKNGSDYDDYSYLYDNPVRWRSMSDGLVFENDYVNKCGFKINTYGNTSSEYYFHNGFLFKVKGDLGIIGDDVYLKRVNVNDPSFIASQYSNGSWGSQVDNKDILIWADAEDYGLSKFDIDSLAISGINFKKFTVIARNGISDSWVDIAEIDTTRLIIDDYEVESNDSNYTIKAYGYDLGADYFEDNHYVYSEDSLKPMLITGSKTYNILCEYNDITMPTSPTLRIFSSRYNVVFDEILRYKQFGIRIDAQLTHEGYYQISNLDFGKLVEIPCFESPRKELNYEFSYNTKNIIDENYHTKNLKSPTRTYDLNYDVATALSANRIQALAKEVALSNRPIWVYEHSTEDRFSNYLCFITSTDSTVLLDENELNYYEVNIALRSVE